jgi:hypothetical protein
MSTEAQITANRANAQLSTGPSSASGKAKSSLNAVKTGLTGRTVLLPGDDAESYKKLTAVLEKQYQPGSDPERLLVQALINTEWRLLRIPSLVQGTLALAMVEASGLHEDCPDPGIRSAMIEAEACRVCKKDLNSFGTQENRLRRNREKDIAALKELQEQRKKDEKRRLNHATLMFLEAQHEGRPFDPAEIGFEFPIERLQDRAGVADRCGFSDYMLNFADESYESRQLYPKIA